MEKEYESGTLTRHHEKLVVDFGLLMELAEDSRGRVDLKDIIGTLEMCEIPISAAVRKLGIVSGVLHDESDIIYCFLGKNEKEKETKKVI